MRLIPVHDCHGNLHYEKVYHCGDFPIEEILKRAQFVRKKKDTYINIPCAYDIETTSVDG